MDSDQVKLLFGITAMIQKTAIELCLVKSSEHIDVLKVYDNTVSDSTLKETTRQLFLEGHYALAVEEAYKFLNNYVKKRTGSSSDGADLMRNAFTPRDPLLKLNKLKTPSQKDQQLGYMEIFAGSMTGIRNPRAHEHRYLDEPFIALELLSFANHLVRLAKGAKMKRKKAQKNAP